MLVEKNCKWCVVKISFSTNDKTCRFLYADWNEPVKKETFDYIGLRTENC